MAARNTHKFELTMGRLGLVLFVLGMSALLFAVFLFGVTVGKNIDTYPDKIARLIPDTVRSRTGWPPGARDLAALPKEEKKTEAAPEKDLDLTFYDTLAKKKGEAAGLIVDAPKGKSQEAGVPAEPPPAAAARPKAAPESKATAQSQKPAAPPSETVPAAAEKPAQATREKYLIQVVSYQKKGKADELAGKLKALGYASRIEVTELPDKGKWFRVIMDGFQSRPEAQKAAERVSADIKGLNCVIRPAEGRTP